MNATKVKNRRVREYSTSMQRQVRRYCDLVCNYLLDLRIIRTVLRGIILLRIRSVFSCMYGNIFCFFYLIIYGQLTSTQIDSCAQLMYTEIIPISRLLKHDVPWYCVQGTPQVISFSGLYLFPVRFTMITSFACSGVALSWRSLPIL